MGDTLVSALLESWADICVDSDIKPYQAHVLADDIVDRLRRNITSQQSNVADVIVANQLGLKGFEVTFDGANIDKAVGAALGLNETKAEN